jgi:hypothetical protein
MTEKQRLAFIKKTVKKLNREKLGLPARGRIPKKVVKEESLDYVNFEPKAPSKYDIDEELELLTKYTADAFVDKNEY